MSREEREEKVYRFLEEYNLSYSRHEHPPVYTVEEAEKYWKDIEGAHTKNLFLRNNKGNRHFLVVLEHNRSANLGEISEKLGAGKLSFASDRRLDKYLGLDTGAVSIFGLVNDTEKNVEVVMDKQLLECQTVNFHPNVNTATVSIPVKDLERFLEACGNKVYYI